MERNSAPPWQKARSTIALPIELSFGAWTETPSKALLEAKDRISALEKARRWELVKKMVNPYEIVYTHEDRFFHPSIALIKPLSRSYFKMIEMMHVLQFFELLPKQQPKIRSAHIAEGPGGFIQALVELCERNKKLLGSATAMTLKPTDQRVPGWRRASVFLHHHREVKLHFGVDGTGDIYSTENQDSFVEASSPSVHLFTADGGFDFSVNYDIQEKCVFRLLVASALTGLRCLSQEGAFIIKIFDIFSDHTKFLIILMSRCFKEWMLYKPSLSRPCNSERYFLGRGFRGLTPQIFSHLNSH
jgi:23S rRNA U2552 (ribose-2'-O)-methylase RlmE/FtsJ